MNAHEYHNNICYGDSWIRSMQKNQCNYWINQLFGALYSLSSVMFMEARIKKGRIEWKRCFPLCKKWWLNPHGKSYNRIVFDSFEHYSFFLWPYFQAFVLILFILLYMENLICSWCTMILIFDAFFNASFAQYDCV